MPSTCTHLEAYSLSTSSTIKDACTAINNNKIICDGDTNCKWVEEYTRLEQRLCKEHATNTIGSELVGKTVQDCRSACISEPLCESFSMGRLAQLSTTGKCKIHNKGCTIDTTIDPLWDFYQQSNEAPNKAANTCSHIPSKSQDKTIIATCKTFLNQNSCTDDVNCQWTPKYGIKHEKGSCAEANKVGTVFTDKIYTAEECNQLCFDESTETCSLFGLGRSDGEHNGYCFLADGTCTSDNDVKYDIYKSSPRLPDPTFLTCTHFSADNEVKARRDLCNPITDKTICSNNNCKWNIIGIKYQNKGCQEDTLKSILALSDKEYTGVTCGNICFENKECTDFTLKKTIPNIGTCTLFKDGCTASSVDNDIDFWKVQQLFDVDVDTTPNKCTHIESERQEKISVNKCKTLINEFQCNKQMNVNTKNCQWLNKMGVSSNCEFVTSLKPYLVDKTQTYDMITVLNDTINFKVIFKKSPLPFSLSMQNFLIWKGINNEAFCEPWQYGLYDDSDGNLLTTDPKFKLDNNPSLHIEGVHAPNKLTISRDTPFNKFMYFKAMTTTSVFNIQKAIFVVCGQEILTLEDEVNSVFNIKTNKSTLQPLLSFELGDIWKVDTNGLLSTPEDCPIEQWKICDDELCAKESTETWIKFDSSTLSISILEGIPFNMKFLAAVTSGKVLMSRPMTISVCGKEEVSLNEIGTEALIYSLGTAKTIKDIKTLFKSQDELNCPVISYSLVSSSNQPLVSAQSSIVSILDGILEIKKDIETTFSFNVVAETASGQYNKKQFDIYIKGENLLATALVNTAPKFERMVDPILKVSLIKGIDGELEDSSVVTYISPKAVDPENNVISMDIDVEGKTFLRGKKNDDDTFYLKINRALLPKKTAKYPVKITIYDEHGAKSMIPTSMVVDVEYVDKQAEEAEKEKELAEIAAKEAEMETKVPKSTSDDTSIEEEAQAEDDNSTGKNGGEVGAVGELPETQAEQAQSLGASGIEVTDENQKSETLSTSTTTQEIQTGGEADSNLSSQEITTVDQHVPIVVSIKDIDISTEAGLAEALKRMKEEDTSVFKSADTMTEKELINECFLDECQPQESREELLMRIEQEIQEEVLALGGLEAEVDIESENISDNTEQSNTSNDQKTSESKDNTQKQKTPSSTSSDSLKDSSSSIKDKPVVKTSEEIEEEKQRMQKIEEEKQKKQEQQKHQKHVNEEKKEIKLLQLLLQNEKEKQKKQEDIQRLRTSGFSRSPAGYSFPGLDQNKISEAALFKQLLQINKNIEIPEEPTLSIPPIDPEGAVGVKFNQDMIAPKHGTFLSPKLYDNTFGMKCVSLIDGSVFSAGFNKSNKQRMLSEGRIEGKADKLGFTPKVVTHSGKEVKIEIEFDDPTSMKMGGTADLGLEVKEPSIFKSAKTLSSMSKDSFEGGKPELNEELPPIIGDPEEAVQIETTSEGAGGFLQVVSSGNVFTGIAFGGSMQFLWGMIRALQLISLSGLVNVNIPVHLHIYLQVCIVFANMDIFNGEEYFEVWFLFKETMAIGDKWAFFGMDNGNFIMNSGSYFVFEVGLLIYFVSFWFFNYIATKFAKNYYARQVGMYFYEQNYFNEFVVSTVKLFLESYFELTICTLINLTSFSRSKDTQDFMEFFGTRDDIICSTITIFYACLVLFFPIYVYKMILFQNGKFDKQEGIIEILMEGVNPHNKHAAFYILYFLIRRLVSAIILVLLVEYQYFQCTFLLVFSTINFIYIINIKPLENSKENRIEIFNELCIMMCSHFYYIFLRGEGSTELLDGTGWSFMGVASFNILGNMGILILDSIREGAENLVHKRQEKFKLDQIKDRRKNREQITREAPGGMKAFEFELSIYEVLAKVKAWLPDRRWLQANKIKFNEFPEEKEFQKLIKKYKLLEKAQYARMSKSILNVAGKLANNEIEALRSQNAIIRGRNQLLSQQQKWKRKNLNVIPASLSDLKKRVKNKQATIVLEKSKKKIELSCISEEVQDEENSSSEEVEIDIDVVEDSQGKDENDAEDDSQDGGEDVDVVSEEREPENNVNIDEMKIYKQNFDKITKTATFEGFTPSTQYFFLGEKENLIKQLTSGYMKRQGEKSDSLLYAIEREIIELKGEGLDENQIEEKQQQLDAEVDLEFILEIEDEDDDKSDELEEIIEREVNKTALQKMEDFQNHDPNLAMTNGGNNDVFQAVLQCLASLTCFVGYFIKGPHIQKGRSKTMSEMLSKVFERLWRRQLQFSLPYINIKFFKTFMSELIDGQQNYCGIAVTRLILQMMSQEVVSQESMSNAMSFYRINDDVQTFQKHSSINNLFSWLLVKNFKCSKNHNQRVLMTSIGLMLRGPQQNESLNDIIKSYFTQQSSTLKCNKCVTVNSYSGIEKMFIVDFPKYMIIFLDPLSEKDGCLQRPATIFAHQIDLTRYKDKESSIGPERNILYNLTGILSHEKTSDNFNSMYTAVVKKRMDGQKHKQWMTFNKEKCTMITEREAISFPAQILFYTLVCKK